MNIKNTNPKHGLTTLEMIPYVRRAGVHSLNWMVHTYYLLLKSRLEFESNKTIDRSILQLQVLLDQFYEEEPKVDERMKYIYALHFPSVYEMTKELGEKYFSLGAVSSALEIFERLEMYEEYVNCLILSDKIKKAEDFVRSRIELDKTDYAMQYQLGVLLDDPSYFETAWELSNKRYSKAKRSLGRYYLKRENYKVAIQHFEEGLKINPLYPMAWFSVGCSYMFLGDYLNAIASFHRVTQQDIEDFETWANLSSCYMKLEKFHEAYKCIQEALKIRPDNWRLWDNYIFATLVNIL
jgi:tetratricopeptide (TPR) repeat protein